jgi:hypothetical protein
MKKATKANQIKELAEELDVFDEMLSTLIELLESKGILTQKEFEEKMGAKIHKKSTKKSFRDVQFGENYP